MPRSIWLPVLGIVLLTGVLGCKPAEDAAASKAAAPAPTAEPTKGVTMAKAHADLVGAPGSGVSGSIEVTDQLDGASVVVHVMGVKPPGQHGIHLHETGTCAPPAFESAGAHFNPGGAPHACDPTTPRHPGDLGNIEVDDSGAGHLELRTGLLTAADGLMSVLGKAIVLHAGPDDCTTQPSGDSGDRLACGVIERVSQ
jgi:superoxide dismutase, Cu-Zn family